MIKNYIVTTWRIISRNKLFSFINIIGLALGICCSLLIMLWVMDERNMDQFHQNGKFLYQVYERNFYDGKVDAGYTTQGLLAEELKRVIPDIEHATGIDYAAAPGNQNTFAAGNKFMKMTGFFGGADFFNMFSFPLLAGSPKRCLDRPNTIAISARMARIFFGNPDGALGKVLRFDNNENLQVTAVFEDIPKNSSLQFDFMRNWIDYVKQNDWVHNWGNTSPTTVIQLRKNSSPAEVEGKIKDFIYRYMGKSAGNRTELGLQPYSEKYLHSNFKNGSVGGGRIEYVRLFTVIAIFILLIACINFMNLATARATKRAKEVGLRKVIGAMRSSLIAQFIGEALVFTFCSFVLAWILAIAILPAFNELTGKQMHIPWYDINFLGLSAGLIFITGIIAGSYPALFLSSLKPIRVLKGTLRFKRSATFFRKSLVVFQFALTIILIVCMIVTYRQMDYIQTRNLGYDRENLIYIPIEGELTKNYDLFKQEAAKMPNVLAISKMRNSPTVIFHHTGSIDWPGKNPNSVVSFADGVVGYDFVKTLKLRLKEGRDFSSAYVSDSGAFIMNETAIEKMGIDHPIGKTVIWGNHPGKIIGVVKDFHFNSMHEAIDPLILRLDEKWPWGTILIRFKTGSTKETLGELEKICKSINPQFPFSYQFSDEEFTKLYKSEQLVSRLSDYFAGLAIIISCMGLFGLTMFVTAQRTKEIGVRKVIGAEVFDIVWLLSRDTIKLVIFAAFIAIPVSWISMQNWLQEFSYHIELSGWIFVTAGLASLVIALLTVGYHTVQAGLASPVNNLRTE
ncbi:MAG: hypothetical protein C5B59_19490 [Bacteroidetes bacterium]|nr:MAG: hypothetical protein C5B59_19490 [Bacteroidota bacterium]